MALAGEELTVTGEAITYPAGPAGLELGLQDWSWACRTGGIGLDLGWDWSYRTRTVGLGLHGLVWVWDQTWARAGLQGWAEAGAALLGLGLAAGLG